MHIIVLKTFKYLSILSYLVYLYLFISLLFDFGLKKNNIYHICCFPLISFNFFNGLSYINDSIKGINNDIIKNIKTEGLEIYIEKKQKIENDLI